VFPTGVSFIQIKVNARKTISGIVYADDFYTNINLQSVSNKTSCT
jgi:small nuclear ribonucleoprotein (snRNP)-like protein